jgi:hypothetical protein
MLWCAVTTCFVLCSLARLPVSTPRFLETTEQNEKIYNAEQAKHMILLMKAVDESEKLKQLFAHTDSVELVDMLSAFVECKVETERQSSLSLCVCA